MRRPPSVGQSKQTKYAVVGRRATQRPSLPRTTQTVSQSLPPRNRRWHSIRTSWDTTRLRPRTGSRMQEFFSSFRTVRPSVFSNAIARRSASAAEIGFEDAAGAVGTARVEIAVTKISASLTHPVSAHRAEPLTRGSSPRAPAIAGVVPSARDPRRTFASAHPRATRGRPRSSRTR